MKNLDAQGHHKALIISRCNRNRAYICRNSVRIQ